MRPLLSILLIFSFCSFLPKAEHHAPKHLDCLKAENGKFKWYSTWTFTPQDGSAANGHPSGYLSINGDDLGITGDDVIELDENGATFYNIEFLHVNGTSGHPVDIRNKAGQIVNVGDVSWTGGGYAQGITMKYCHYFKLHGTTSDQGSLIINCSTLSGRDAVRDLELGFYTDNFEIYYLTITNGGNGIFWKTEVDGADPNSWRHGVTVGSTIYPGQFNASDKVLNNGVFHDLTVDGCWNEGIYSGHTAEWWNLNGIPIPKPFDPTTRTDFTACASDGGQTTAQYNQYKKPIMNDNTIVYNVTIKNNGADGIQFASTYHVYCYKNLVTHWAGQADSSTVFYTTGNATDLGGIVVGGGVINTDIHDNEIIYSKAGEPLQFYGSGGGTHLNHNNLYVAGRDSAGIFLPGLNNCISIDPRAAANKAMPSACTVTFDSITCIGGDMSVRNNGFFDDSPQPMILKRMLFIQPTNQSSPGVLYYIYQENGASNSEASSPNNNLRYSTFTASGLDKNNHFAPPGGITVQGYRYISTGGGGSPYTPTIKNHFVRHFGKLFKTKQG